VTSKKSEKRVSGMSAESAGHPYAVSVPMDPGGLLVRVFTLLLGLPILLWAEVRSCEGGVPPQDASLARYGGHDWGGFRGDGRSHAPEGKYPVHWSPYENIAWAADLPGYGQSAPVVYGGAVYVLAVEGPNKETNHVLAFDRERGERRWDYSFPTSAPAKNTPMVGRAAPTPAVDENRLYAFFESGDLVAFSHEGEQLWQRSLTSEYGPFTNRHGLGSSLAQSDDALFVLVDQNAAGYLLAVSKQSGETLWKTDRPDRTGWSSPVVAELAGVVQVVVSAGGTVEGYDAASGELLWSHEGLTGNSLPSPTVAGDSVFVAARLGRQGGDIAAVSGSHRRIQVFREGETLAAKMVWQAEKVVSHYASPVVGGGSVFYTNNIGVLYRLDAETGELLERVRGGRPCWATPIYAEPYLYLFGEEGTSTVFETGTSLRQIASNRLWDESNAPQGDPFAHARESETEGAIGPSGAADAEYDRPTVFGVAAADGAFFLRTGTRLYCVAE
jgi:outer membrane protein assembly factor BamB